MIIVSLGYRSLPLAFISRILGLGFGSQVLVSNTGVFLLHLPIDAELLFTICKPSSTYGEHRTVFIRLAIFSCRLLSTSPGNTRRHNRLLASPFCLRVCESEFWEISGKGLNFYIMHLPITPRSKFGHVVSWKKICKVGLRPAFGLRTKSCLFLSSHPLPRFFVSHIGILPSIPSVDTPSELRLKRKFRIAYSIHVRLLRRTVFFVTTVYLLDPRRTFKTACMRCYSTCTEQPRIGWSRRML